MHALFASLARVDILGCRHCYNCGSQRTDFDPLEKLTMIGHHDLMIVRLVVSVAAGEDVRILLVLERARSMTPDQG